MNERNETELGVAAAGAPEHKGGHADAGAGAALPSDPRPGEPPRTLLLPGAIHGADPHRGTEPEPDPPAGRQAPLRNQAHSKDAGRHLRERDHRDAH